MEDLIALPRNANSEQINNGKLDEGEVFFFFSRRAKKLNASLNSFVEIYEEPVGAADTRGVPIAIKDNICIKGKRITCASKILK